MKNVIVGASAAGIACATKLRELNKDVDILVIDAEEKLPCNRCLLSDLLAGDKTEQEILIRKQDDLRQQGIDLLLSTMVTDILPQENCVKLQSGQKIIYDKLFLGTGKTGFVPSISGADKNGVFSFYGLSDVNSILNFIQKHKVKHVTVVGAGLTGLECADALSKRGFQVAVIERCSHVLPYQVDAQGAQIIQDLMKKHLISFYPGQIVEEIVGDEFVRSIVLSEYGTLETDMIIFSIGGKPNIQIALRAGIDTLPQGILTKPSMQTSISNIFSGGDSCAVRDLISGKIIQSCLWTEAALQGMVAAHNMLEIGKEYQGMLAITSSNIFGTSIVTCGPIGRPSDDYKEFVIRGDNFYQKYLTHNQTLAGFAMIGKSENIGMLRRALIEKNYFPLNRTLSQ